MLAIISHYFGKSKMEAPISIELLVKSKMKVFTNPDFHQKEINKEF
jgi:hypothetical protein